jgi:hypothetical protein
MRLVRPVPRSRLVPVRRRAAYTCQNSSSQMQVMPSSTLSASRIPGGSPPCRAVNCAYACCRAMPTAAATRRSARVPARAISATVRYAVGTDATRPNSSR